MAKKSLIDEHEQYVKKLNRIEGQYASMYHGFKKVGLPRVYQLSDDIRTITDDDTPQTIKAKTSALKNLVEGKHGIVAIEGATVQNRFLAKEYVKQADMLQSKVNYEQFKLQMAGSFSKYTKKKNLKTGAFDYEQQPYDYLGAGIETPNIAIKGSNIFNIKGTDYVIGARIPKGLSKERKLAYETWLYNMAQVPQTQLSSSKQAYRYGIFKSDKQYSRKDRLEKYQKNIIKALNGEYSIKTISNKKGERLQWGTNLNKLIKEIKSLAPKDFLYLSFRYPDMFDFGYLYSPADYKNKINDLISTIQSFKQFTLQDTKSFEHKQYKKYLKELGSYYD